MSNLENQSPLSVLHDMARSLLAQPEIQYVRKRQTVKFIAEEIIQAETHPDAVEIVALFIKYPTVVEPIESLTLFKQLCEAIIELPYGVLGSHSTEHAQQVLEVTNERIRRISTLKFG